MLRCHLYISREERAISLRLWKHKQKIASWKCYPFHSHLDGFNLFDEICTLLSFSGFKFKGILKESSHSFISQLSHHTKEGYSSTKESSLFRQLIHNIVYINEAKHLIKTRWGVTSWDLASVVQHQRMEYQGTGAVYMSITCQFHPFSTNTPCTWKFLYQSL